MGPTTNVVALQRRESKCVCVCEQGNVWLWAVELSADLAWVRVEHETPLYSAAVSACVQGCEWSRTEDPLIMIVMRSGQLVLLWVLPLLHPRQVRIVRHRRGLSLGDLMPWQMTPHTTRSVSYHVPSPVSI